MQTASHLQPEVPEKFEGLWRDNKINGWPDEWRQDPYRYIALHGGRGGAKSHQIAESLIVRGRLRRLRWLCAREIQKSLAASSMQLLTDKIEKYGLQSFYSITKEGIFGKNGTRFLFAGLRTNPDSVKSMEGLDGVWVEEADRCMQVSLDLLTPTVRKPGSQLIFSFNRSSVKAPVDAMFLGGEPPPNSWVQQVNWRDNPWFDDTPLREEMLWMMKRDRDKWRHVWEGEPLNRQETKVFTNWTIDDLDKEALASEEVWLWGADWGFSVDPTVLVKCKIMGRTLYISDEAYKVKCEIDETPSLFAGSDDRDPARWSNPHGHPGLPGVMQGLITSDSARPETISYMSARGFHIRGAVKGAKSVEEGVEFLKSHDIVVHPRCTHTIDELETYQYKVDKITDEVLPELADKDNHVIDALRYAVESHRKARRGRIAILGARTVAIGE
jgi:phage terminase large subunit